MTLFSSHVQRKFRTDPAIAINAFDFNHNGTMCLLGGHDGSIRILDCTTMQAIVTWKAHSHVRYDLCIIDGESVSVNEWIQRVTDHLQSCIAVRFSHDETTIFSMGLGDKLKRYNLFANTKTMINDWLLTMDSWDVYSTGKLLAIYEYVGAPHSLTHFDIG